MQGRNPSTQEAEAGISLEPRSTSTALITKQGLPHKKNGHLSLRVAMIF